MCAQRKARINVRHVKPREMAHQPRSRSATHTALRSDRIRPQKWVWAPGPVDEPLVAPAPLTRRGPWGKPGSIYLAMLSGLLKGEPNPPDAYGHPQPFLQQRRSLPIPLAARPRSSPIPIHMVSLAEWE